MPSQKKRPVTLSSADRDFLERLTTTGVHPASMIRRARVLLANQRTAAGGGPPAAGFDTVVRNMHQATKKKL